MNCTRRLTFSVAALIAGLAMLTAPPQAEATFQLRISNDGGGTFNPAITDNLAGDLNPLAGVIVVNVGAVSITSTASNLITPSLTTFDLALQGQAAAGVYNLVVQSSFDGVNTAPPPQVLGYSFTGSAQGIGGVLTAAMRTLVDDNNGLFGVGAIAADTGSLSVPNAGSILFNANDPYSVTQEVKITGTITSAISLSFDNNGSITNVPAPAAIALAIAGAPVFGFSTWIRRRRTLATA